MEQTTSSELIDRKIESLGGWRGEMLGRLRGLIRAADPQVIETVKWRKATNPLGVPVWEHDGIVCTGETYKDKIKLTFAQGASLADPAGVYNGKDTGATRRSIDVFEGDAIHEDAFKALVRAAVAFNTAKARTRKS